MLTAAEMPSLAGPAVVGKTPSSRRIGPGFHGSSWPVSVETAARWVRRDCALWKSAPKNRNVPPT